MARNGGSQTAKDAHSGYVGAGTKLTGRLRAPGPFHVNGAFAGEIFSEDLVSVGTGGVVDGTIVARKVVVEAGGRIIGKINAQEMQVRSGGNIAGTGVQAARLLLEADGNADGASFRIRRDHRYPPRPAPSSTPAPKRSAPPSKAAALPSRQRRAAGKRRPARKTS